MVGLIQIFICPDRRLAMREVPSVRAIPGVGLEGDRYSRNKGSWSKAFGDKIRHITLISQEAINEANVNNLVPFLAVQTRRNLVTSGIDLNSLVGKEFYVGCVRMRGTELCTPCDHPRVLRGMKKDKGDFAVSFHDRGGLRAEILMPGLLLVRDPITLGA